MFVIVTRYRKTPNSSALTHVYGPYVTTSTAYRHRDKIVTECAGAPGVFEVIVRPVINVKNGVTIVVG